MRRFFVVLFLGSILVSLFVAPDFVLALIGDPGRWFTGGGLSYVAVVVVAVLARVFRGAARGVLSLVMLVGSASVLALSSVGVNRPGGFAGNSIVFANVALLAVPALITWRTGGRWYAFFVAGLSIVAFLAAGSVGALVATVAVVMAWLFRGRLRRLSWLLPIVLVLVGVVGFTLHPSTGMVRFQLWVDGLNRFAAGGAGVWLVGYGLGSQARALCPIGLLDVSAQVCDKTHNAVLDVLLERGVLGVVSSFGLALPMARRLPGVAAYLLSLQMSFVGLPDQLVMAVLWGLL